MPDPKKGKPDFSDVRGSGSSTERASQPPAGQQYTVEKGDSLSKIAQRIYGDANQWKRIYEANRDQIKDPDLIHPGQRLTLPAV
jgi:nucleoid-associated protein YgaU